jgi:hypothetical protein
MAKSFVTITRLWHNPQIQILVSNEAIGLRMSMADFREALKAEIGKPECNQTIDNAITRILEGIKEESRKAV